MTCDKFCISLYTHTLWHRVKSEDEEPPCTSTNGNPTHPSLAAAPFRVGLYHPQIRRGPISRRRSRPSSRRWRPRQHPQSSCVPIQRCRRGRRRDRPSEPRRCGGRGRKSRGRLLRGGLLLARPARVRSRRAEFAGEEGQRADEPHGLRRRAQGGQRRTSLLPQLPIRRRLRKVGSRGGSGYEDTFRFHRRFCGGVLQAVCWRGRAG
mmetsp:Transcript_41491/g.88404  ORF Transcript_41491/g.88404 Transcript_41491/m.88404 type:complete len:207 (-) Transcript_41491:421-1041(-)